MVALLLAVWTATAMPGQVPAPTPPPGTGTAVAAAEAYYEFLRARRLEGEGDAEGAVAALERAGRADPRAAEVRAELAGLYARQNRAEDAVASAEEALRLDPDNGEAHWVLGTVYAALAQGRRDDEPAAAGTPEIEKAIHHLERARVDRRFDLGLHLGLGRLYVRTGNWDKAVEVLGWLVAEEPGIAEAVVLLAEAHEKNGQPAEAVSLLQGTLGDEPRHFRGWVTLAELLERQRDFSGAAEAYGRAAAMSPRNAELRVRQGSALLTAGEPAAARVVLEDAVKLAPTEPGGLYLLSEAERRARDYDAAEAVARRLVALEPRGVRGAYALALVFAERREHERVVETLGPALERQAAGQAGRGLVGPLVNLGFAYQQLGRYEDAVSSFERAKAAAGGDRSIDVYVAQAWLTAKQYDRAVDVARAARTASPADGRLLRVEARALVERGDVDEGLGLLRAQAGADAGLDAVLALADGYAAARQWDEATRVLDQAEVRFPDEVAVAFQRGAVLEQQGRLADAEAAFRQALALESDHAPTLNYLGYMLAERGERLDEAIELVSRALEHDPYNGAYLDSLGWAYFKQGDLDRAFDLVGRAAAMLPTNSVVQDHLGDVLAARRDFPGAIHAWERALAGDRETIDEAVVRAKISDARRALP